MPHASESESCLPLIVFQSAWSARDANGLFRLVGGTARLGRQVRAPVDQALKVLDRVGNRQLARHQSVSDSGLTSQSVDDYSAVFRRFHRFWLPFVLCILPCQFQEDLVGPLEEIVVLGRDEYVKPRLVAGVGLSAAMIPPPVSTRRAWSHVVSSWPAITSTTCQFAEPGVVKQLFVLGSQLQVVLKARVGETVDHAIGALDLETDNRVGRDRPGGVPRAYSMPAARRVEHANARPRTMSPPRPTCVGPVPADPIRLSQAERAATGF